MERKKKTMTTHEVEEMLGITKQSLIYYEKEGLIHPKRNENNYRNYMQKDINILKNNFIITFYGSIHR